jgi:hypothetical protein
MAGDEFPKHPPKPRLTLRVGVTGKRQLPLEKHADISAKLAKVFEILAQVLSDTWERNRAVLSDELPVLRIVCGLAEGADWLGAQVAIDRASGNIQTKAKCETRLAAILPFWREEFIKDFELDPNRDDGKYRRTPQELKAAVDRFDELLKEARKTSVLELHDEELVASGKPGHRDLAYVALRDLLVQHSDVLVAVFDESRERKPGGSADVTQMAGQEGVPIIRISTASAATSLIYPAELDDPDQRPKPRKNSETGKDEVLELDARPPAALAALLESTLSPPPFEETGHIASHGHASSRSGGTRLVDFLDEEFRLASFGWIFKACRHSLIVWSKCSWRNCCPVTKAAFLKRRNEYETDPPAPPVTAIHGLWRSKDTLAEAYSEEAHFRLVLANRHIWADKLAVRYADATRSSYILIASWGALAVLVGLLSILFWGHVGAVVKFLALFVEGTILWWAGTRLFRPAHNKRWHERMVEYRVLAELLRHQRFIYAFGGAERAERSGERSWREPGAWLSWYVRATIRELGFPSVRLKPDYRRRALEAFQSEELQSQVGYNQRELLRSKSIDESLGAFVEGGWWWAVAIAYGGSLIVLVLFLTEISGGPLAHAAELVLVHAAKPGFAIVMAFLPALIAAVHGVRFQMEFANATKRAEATLRELRFLDDERVKPLLTEGAPPPGRRKSYGLVRDANEAMVADLTGWSTVYKHKAAEPPG